MNTKKEYGWYKKTFSPHSQSDRRALRRMAARGQKSQDGGWMFGFLPLSDPINGTHSGPRRRCPAGVELYTPYGWNALDKIAEAFARGEEVWIESDGE